MASRVARVTGQAHSHTGMRRKEHTLSRSSARHISHSARKGSETPERHGAQRLRKVPGGPLDCVTAGGATTRQQDKTVGLWLAAAAAEQGSVKRRKGTTKPVNARCGKRREPGPPEAKSERVKRGRRRAKGGPSLVVAGGGVF